jgi:hypothetical protein
VELNEAISMDVDVEAGDMDGFAQTSVCALSEGGPHLRGGIVDGWPIAEGGGRSGVMRMKVYVQHDEELVLLIGRVKKDVDGREYDGCWVSMRIDCMT